MMAEDDSVFEVKAKNFAENFFRSCDKRTTDPVKGEVKGEIPKWLEGTLLRNGPGIYNVGKERFKHAFDGLAVLHHFKVANGEVHYFNRALESDAYAKDMEANRIVVGEFGTFAHTDPCAGLFDRFKMTFTGLRGGSRLTDNCCVNVAFYGDQLYAMTETNLVRRISPEDLKCIGGSVNLTECVALNTASAHPHVLEDGTAINLGNQYRHKGGPHYCFVKIPPSNGNEETVFQEATLIGAIPSRWRFNPSYFHSFGLTTDKILFMESPFCLNLPAAATRPLFKRSIQETITWHENQKSRFHVMTIEDGKEVPIVYETEGFFTFHHVNTFEQDGYVIADICGYKNANIVKALTEKETDLTGDAMKGACVLRFAFPLDIKDRKPGENLVTLPDCKATAVLRSANSNIVDCTAECLTDFWVDFPRINYKFNGRHYNYMYGACSKTSEGEVPHHSQNTIIKLNVNKPEEKHEWIYSNGVVSEPIFVPDPSKSEEDDGILLTTVQENSNDNKITLFILNAKDLQEIASVAFTAEGCVSSTFHGLWAQAGDSIHSY